MSPSTQNRSFLSRFPEPISWLGMEKTKPNTTKARIRHSKEMYYNTKKHKKTFTTAGLETNIIIYSAEIKNRIKGALRSEPARLRMVWYGIVNVDLYSAIITKVSNALNTLVSKVK